MAGKIDPRPVQVFLDTKKFIALEEPTDFGGGNKDFYKDNDRGFADQKQRVRRALTGISGVMKSAKKPAGFIHVQMREDALGKSYRPLGSLFTRNRGFALVGGGRIGEMIFQATPQALEALDAIIEEKAEPTPRIATNKKTGQPEPRVSGYRSEVGGIADIALHDTADRVAFSAAEAAAWFRSGNTLGGYLVELFRPRADQAPEAVRAMVTELKNALDRVPGGIMVRPFLPADNTERFGEPPLAITVQLLADAATRRIELPFALSGAPAVQAGEQSARASVGLLNLEEKDHQRLLDLLAAQSLVRSVELPPTIEAAPASIASSAASPAFPMPTENAAYPVVGIVDGGVAQIQALQPWCVGDAGLVPPQDRDESHGTFIAGLVAGAHVLNPHAAEHFETGGCKFFDLDLFPKRELRSTYYGGDADYLFDILEEKIKIAKNQHNVRVFNFSFGLRAPGQRFGYSHFADRFDRIARANDVILIVSAGNLPPGGGRPPWSPNHVEAVTMLAGFGAVDQRISHPAEHLLGLTVGAVNPPGVRGHEPHLPTTYTRRGPGVGGARKPDLAHIGGVESSSSSGNQTGLVSLAANGDCVESCGTSFAAPSVAATIATLDKRLEHAQPRELLMALPVHRARRAKPLTHSALRHISREFVGYGQAPSADTLLLDDPFAITLVFSDTLLRKQRLEFPFTWPAALVTDKGSCRGSLELTLAYTPPIDPDHKDEAQRVELEAFVHQESIDPETGEAAWASQLMQDGSGVPPGMNKTERYMLATGLKWTPIKRFHANMPQGRGNSSNWRLSLSSLTRAGALFPDEGVNFCLILTLVDPKRAVPIHDNVRNTLVNQGLQVADILVAHRVRPRK